MKPQRFEIGQAVSLRKKPKGVTNVESNEKFPCPLSHSEIYHIAGYGEGRGSGKGEWYVFIAEYNHNCLFNEDGFEPVISDNIISELLEESLKTQPQEI